MHPTRGWLNSHNLPPVPRTRRRNLSAEAVAYALVTHVVRPSHLPDDVLVLLAEQCFSRMSTAES